MPNRSKQQQRGFEPGIYRLSDRHSTAELLRAIETGVIVGGTRMKTLTFVDGIDLTTTD